MESIRKTFFRGLMTMLPFLLTIYIIYWGITFVENLLGSGLRMVMPEYIPGLGIVLTLLLVYGFGLVLNNFLGEQLLSFVERRLNHVPLVKAIYSNLKEVTHLFSKDHQKDFRRVVLLQVGDHQVLGVVTRENFSDLPDSLGLQQKVAVYIPMSYGVGGYTLLAPKDRLKEIDIPLEKAFSLALTGWVHGRKKEVI